LAYRPQRKAESQPRPPQGLNLEWPTSQARPQTGCSANRCPNSGSGLLPLCSVVDDAIMIAIDPANTRRSWSSRAGAAAFVPIVRIVGQSASRLHTWDCPSGQNAVRSRADSYRRAELRPANSRYAISESRFGSCSPRVDVLQDYHCQLPAHIVVPVDPPRKGLTSMSNASAITARVSGGYTRWFSIKFNIARYPV
jgi:hypothetical protein